MDRVSPMHHVCTCDEARALTGTRRRFWVSNCGCREQAGGSLRSKIDVCTESCVGMLER